MERRMKMSEIAKFCSGVAANQVLTHAALSVSGTQVVMFGITYSPITNTVAAGFWAVATAALVYAGWGKSR